MYFMVISQWPQTAETIGYNFLPLRPLNAMPRYWPSTTNDSVPSSMSSTAVKEQKVTIVSCHSVHTTMHCADFNYWNEYCTNPKICQERYMTLRAWEARDTWRRCCFSSRGKVYSYRGPSPSWARCCRRDSGSRRCAGARPPLLRRRRRACRAALCSSGAPTRACPSCSRPSLVCSLCFVRRGVGETWVCHRPKK